MKELHELVAHTAKEVTIKENLGFRIRLEKHEVIAPKGLFSLDIIRDSQTYNFFMTKEELQSLANGLTA